MLLNSSSDNWSHEMLTRVEDCSGNSPDACMMIGDLGEFIKKLSQVYDTGATVPTSNTRAFHHDGNDNHRIGSPVRMAYEVFLGGSCNPTTWRADIAIPTLQKFGITYYNPQVSEWKPELIAEEFEAKENARVLLFVIDRQTRNTSSIIEVAQLAASRCHSLVLVVYHYQKGQTICGEKISAHEYCDLMNGVLVLQYFMERQRIPIFENLSGALNGTYKILREATNVQDLNSEDGMMPTQLSMTQNEVDIIAMEKMFRSLDQDDTGGVRLGDAWIALQSNDKCNVSLRKISNAVSNPETYKSENFIPNDNPTDRRINFDEFCDFARECTIHPTSYGTTYENWVNSHVLESEKRHLYIGVVDEDLNWLNSVAAPFIESMGLTLYHPHMNDYTMDLLPHELQCIINSRVILLIIPNHSRGIAISALAAYLIGLRAKLVLCIQLMPNGVTISGEQLTPQATKDYNRGRNYLSDYATREGVPVFANIADAFQHAIKLVQSLIDMDNNLSR